MNTLCKRNVTKREVNGVEMAHMYVIHRKGINIKYFGLDWAVGLRPIVRS